MDSLLVVALQAVTSNAYSPNWVQPRFMVSFWVDPIVAPEDFAVRYQEIKEANFTVIMGGFGAKTADAVTAQLQAAKAYDLGVIAAGAAGISDYNNATNLWGYQLKDEPKQNEFAGLRNLTDAIKAQHPGKLRYINLLPTCPTSCLNATDYDTYVKNYVEIVQPDVLSMDNYPHFDEPRNGSAPSLDGYRADLATMRKYSLAAGIPFWNYFSTMPVYNEHDPTEAQLRWQVFTSLTYGAKGIMYFCYWSPGGSLNGGIMAPKGNASNYEATAHYAQAARINSHVLAYEQHLLRATSVNVWYVESGGPPSARVVVTLTKTPGTGDMLDYLVETPIVGEFVLADDRTAVMIQNQNAEFAGSPTVSFNTTHEILEVSSISGKESPVEDENPGMPGIQIGILSGSARLFVFAA